MGMHQMVFSISDWILSWAEKTIAVNKTDNRDSVRQSE